MAPSSALRKTGGGIAICRLVSGFRYLSHAKTADMDRIPGASRHLLRSPIFIGAVAIAAAVGLLFAAALM